MMLKAHDGAEVDILDRLPTPFGLVRSGVAPDHPETKIVVNQFSRVAANERCSFFGNVNLGTTVSLSDLCEMYDAVVLAYGAESDRYLGVPGEDLGGIYSAREFVWWYNGHPDYSNMSPDLKNTDTAVVLGQGNVALDVARILLRPINELETTDIAEHALTSLRESTIRKVYLVGRRGPVQAACTAKELREILGIKDLHVHIQKADLGTSLADEEELKKSRIKRRVYELFSKAATSHQQHDIVGQRELHFMFFRKPDRFLPSESGNTVFNYNILLVFRLVLKSIGYKSVPVDGLPFDEYRGLVPNTKGRILRLDQAEHAIVEQGLYVAGWLKRGPTGIIATNLYCAEETVASILEDFKNGLLTPSSGSHKPGRQGLLQVLENKNVRFVPFSGWEKIDMKERMEGELRNKPRKKITTWEELLLAVDG
ncbi:NADPH:adrenodoxin oxidoreductase, mitochondrial [Cocos nucifera]|uniref:NADPH:adrenodoxin oxidoreductase, mitochondrial n=1 Tax=Cocos nucifera TaxID=13894 RepID=A0A8K0IGQ5_COCNU|nr:NADPH:adrenodoxin oxidoreductase, mitochondrial [Cocos nucifera]